jgi:hypothetical protein
MKNTLLKITAITFLAAAIVNAPAGARAEDAATNAPAAKKEKAGGEKFYGPVTAVDASAKTFTVGDQTFTVTDKSELTKDDKSATLADAVVGEPARGSYEKGKDGKLEVTKVRFGKKSAAGKTGGKSGGKKSTTTADAAGDTAPAKDSATPAAK